MRAGPSRAEAMVSSMIRPSPRPPLAPCPGPAVAAAARPGAGPGRGRRPTCGEHAPARRAGGHRVGEVAPAALADLSPEEPTVAVACNLNNLDGHVTAPEALLALATRLGRSGDRAAWRRPAGARRKTPGRRSAREGARPARRRVSWLRHAAGERLASGGPEWEGSTGAGWVAERLKAPVLKTGKGSRPSWVRIPPHPPISLAKAFSPSGCGRIFPLYSRVMRVERLTARVQEPRGGRLYVLGFSRPLNHVPAVKRLEHLILRRIPVAAGSARSEEPSLSALATENEPVNAVDAGQSIVEAASRACR